MDEIIFKFNKKDIEKKIEESLRTQVKSHAVTIGLASWDIKRYIEDNKDLKELIKTEIKSRLRDDKFMKGLIRDIIKGVEL